MSPLPAVAQIDQVTGSTNRFSGTKSEFPEAPKDAPVPSYLPAPTSNYTIDMDKVSRRMKKSLTEKKPREVNWFMGIIPEPGYARPPEPSYDPWFRERQRRGWLKAPYETTGFWLNMAKGPGGLAFIGSTFCVHDSIDLNKDGYYEWDLLDSDTFGEAARMGRILRDPNIYDPANEIEAFVYRSEKDREICREKGKVIRHFTAPPQLKAFIDDIKDIPFPEYDPVKNPAPQMRYDFSSAIPHFTPSEKAYEINKPLFDF